MADRKERHKKELEWFLADPDNVLERSRLENLCQGDTVLYSAAKIAYPDPEFRRRLLEMTYERLLRDQDDIQGKIKRAREMLDADHDGEAGPSKTTTTTAPGQGGPGTSAPKKRQLPWLTDTISPPPPRRRKIERTEEDWEALARGDPWSSGLSNQELLTVYTKCGLPTADGPKVNKHAIIASLVMAQLDVHPTVQPLIRKDLEDLAALPEDKMHNRVRARYTTLFLDQSLSRWEFYKAVADFLAKRHKVKPHRAGPFMGLTED